MPTPTNNLAHQAVFAPEFFGPVGRFATMARNCAHGIENLVARDIRYDKRSKSLHRTTIADTRGPLRLTIPVCRPVADAGRAPRWSDVAISTHDQWWGIHWTTLESAYGRTPFFEFYADRFKPFFSADTPGRFNSIVDLDIEADNLACELLLLPSPTVTEGRRPDEIKLPTADDIGPYYQVRSGQFGFLDSLSVLDLLFNMGPEAALVVRRYLPTLPASAKQSPFA